MNTPVWFTRALIDEEVSYARTAGIEPVVHPLISIRLYPVVQIVEDAAGLPKPDALLFTSRNAVDAFLTCRVLHPGWMDGTKIFAVGEKTAARLLEKGIEAEYAAEQSGEGIARRITENKPVGSVIWHFCSSIKRPESGEVLNAAGLNYQSVECYETIELKEAGLPEEPFKAVVFYSPSAVRAFAATPGYQDVDTLFAAIGPTTAEELQSKGINNVILPEKPSTESIINLLKGKL